MVSVYGMAHTSLVAAREEADLQWCLLFSYLCSVYHISLTPPFILRTVTRRLLSYFFFLKEDFPRILKDLVSLKWSI